MPNEPVKITAQELEEIKKLPSCQFMLGGTPQTGFFDKVNEKIYYLDSEGNWMVKRARVKKREPEKPQEEEAQQRQQQDKDRIFHNNRFFRIVTTSSPAGSSPRCCAGSGRC